MFRVLCIEDETAFREDVADYLRMQAFEVDEAASGEEALHKLRTQHYDAIISDISMPRMDGFELLKRLPHDVASPPFLFLTAMADADHQVQGRTLGAEDYLTKPVNFKVLLSTLKQRIQSHHAVQTMLHENESNDMHAPLLAETVRGALATPLLQVSEITQFVAALPDDAPLSQVKPMLGHLQEAAHSYLYQIQMLHEFLLMPHGLPETARPIGINEAFMRHTLLSAFGENAAQRVQLVCSESVPTVVMEPDMLVASLAQLMHSAPHDVMHIRVKHVENFVHLVLSDNAACSECELSSLRPLSELLASVRERAALQPRLLALLHTQALMHMHGGTLSLRCTNSSAMSVVLSLPIHQAN